MLTQSQRIQSQAIAAMAQLPHSPTTCINSIVHSCQEILKTKSVYSPQLDEDGVKRMYLNQYGHKLVSTMPIIKDCPFINGRIAHAKAHPFLEAIYPFLSQTGLICIQPNQELNQSFILEKIQLFLNYLLTRQYAQLIQDWNELLLEAKAQFDAYIKDIKKSVSGYDVHELVCIYPINQDMYPNAALINQSDFAESMDKEITRLICQSEENKVCGVLVKRELTIHHQLVHRYLIFTECQYIDDPSSFTNLGFIEEVKHLIEPNSQNRVGLASNHLNGFLLSNRFIKKSSDFKEQMKLLKAYVVSTDQFIRVGGIQPTFDVLFSKAQKD
ncbi:hypothetical protein [Acinetobacter baumannii]|uniref:hypothetical protein n=1 Tax=Acinetobacter baumannii TaxID=470 RepID=UPI00148F35E6|nr:hypothetical protein [Acinetobacter baumannii]